MKRAKGEVVQVDGGHILRSIGRKDRHSKVYTAKGPRDRRVRLSAHTAIQFYDVQERLGYERPSKAVDWLMTKAKNAIDKLAEIPQWNPNDDGVLNNVMPTSAEADEGSSGSPLEPQLLSDNSSSRLLSQRQIAENPMHMMQSVADNSNSKSFFPMNFLGFPHEVMSQDSIENEDLGLSLHTNLHDLNSNHSTDQSHFSSPNQVSFEANNPRLIGSWIIPHQELLSSQGGTLFYQREPLQSNNYSNHAWGAQRPKIGGDHQSSISNGNFQFPAARIHGEDERGYSGF